MKDPGQTRREWRLGDATETDAGPPGIWPVSFGGIPASLLILYLLSAESDDHHPASDPYDTEIKSSAENGMTKCDPARTTRTDVCVAYFRNPSSSSSHSRSSPKSLDLMSCTHPPISDDPKHSTSPYLLQHKDSHVNVSNGLLQLHSCSRAGGSGT